MLNFQQTFYFLSYWLNVANIIPTLIVYFYLLNEEYVFVKDKINLCSSGKKKAWIFFKLAIVSFFKPNHLVFRLSVPLCLFHPVVLPF